MKSSAEIVEVVEGPLVDSVAGPWPSSESRTNFSAAVNPLERRYSSTARSVLDITLEEPMVSLFVGTPVLGDATSGVDVDCAGVGVDIV